MKVCYWTPNAGGGAGKYEHYLPKEIKKLGIEVEVFRRPKGLKGNPLTLRLFYSQKGISSMLQRRPWQFTLIQIK